MKNFFKYHRAETLALALAATMLLPGAVTHAQISKADQILINRGLQVEGLVATYDTFNLSTFSNANYTAVCWLWDSPRSFDSMSQLGAAPGFPWARWVANEFDMPPLGGESDYLGQLVNLQLADEWDLNDDTIRTRAVDWFNAVVRSDWTNTILSANNWGGQISDGNLIDFVTRAQPDMICFDTYPWKSAYDINAPDHIGAPIGGPPTAFYTFLRIYRDISRAYNIPFGSYVQTFHAVEEWWPNNVYRNPSPSELRLNHFGALAFNSKMLIDFVYNNGASSLFDAPGGDSNPNALYYEKADCARRARNFGKALVRLKPIDEGTPLWTTSVMFVRGKDANGNLNPIPVNFYAGPGGDLPNTDWVADRNDKHLRGWVVTNKGTKNNGQPGDVLISWFKPLDESLGGTNEVYLMVVNGLTDTNGTAADCAQEIKLNFLDNFSGAVELLDPLTGVAHPQAMPVISARRQLVLNLNGGDAALFRIATNGVPFIGCDLAGPPVITGQPVSLTQPPETIANFAVTAYGYGALTYQWRKNGSNLSDGGNLSGATSSALTLSNITKADEGSFDVIVTGGGSVTSAPPAVLTVVNPTGQLLLYEPFDYPNIGGPVSSNTPANWSYGGGGTNDLSVVAGNLSYPGVVTPVGNSVTNGGVGLGVRRSFGLSLNSGAVYFSALFRINDLGFGTWNGAGTQVGALIGTDNTAARLQIMVKSNATSTSGYVFGVLKGGAGSSAVYDTIEHSAGETVFLVGKYDFTTSPNTVSLWVNPPASTFGAASEPSSGFISATSTLDGVSIDRFNMRQNTAPTIPASIQWDELRVGSTWATVTPSTHMTGWKLLAGGAFQFSYADAPGLTRRVFASTNLVDWADIGTGTEITPGRFQFTDTSAPNHTHRFYQLRTP